MKADPATQLLREGARRCTVPIALHDVGRLLTPPNAITPKDEEQAAAPGCRRIFADGGKFLEVDTSTTGQVVTAKAQIALGARGTRGEVREFSYWVILDHPNGRIRRVPNRVLEIHQGEFGLVGLVFGVERPRIEWYPMPQLGAVERWPDLFRHLRDQLGPGPDPGPALVITPRASEP